MLAILLLQVGALLFGIVSTAPPNVSDEQRPAHLLANSNPYFAQNLPMFVYATTDVPIDLAIMVADTNDDVINVTWEWGDGTPNAQNTTPPASTAVWVNQTHTWSIQHEPGEPYPDPYTAGPFLINITLDDGMGGVTRTQRSAYVFVPANEYPAIGLSAPDEVETGETVSIVANATDFEGDPLVWTFVFNDSLQDYDTRVFNTSWSNRNETVWNNITAAFPMPGTYSITLYVSDALPPNQTFPHNISYLISIKVKDNSAPELLGVINTNPQMLIIDATIGYLVVNYSVEAFDADGDVIHVDWDFGDGTATATNISLGGSQLYKFVQQRNYSDTGTFNISVVIGDGRESHNVSLFRLVEIESTNLPPSVVRLGFTYSEGRSYAIPNETIVFDIVMSDPELNSLEVVVDFGDNSSEERYTLTDFTDGNVSLTLNHTFSLPGEYTIVIWYTDNKSGLFEHSKYYNVTVVVKVPPPVVHKYWDWWDYTSLGLLICAFVLPTIWLMRDLMRRED